MRIVGLQISNVLRLSAVSIKPKGSKVIIAGKNGAGKTSILNAIEMALLGGRSIPAEPVRRGARKGDILLDLGDIVVERRFNAKGTTLVVRDQGGQELRSPQAVLDALCNRIMFDPLTFARAKPADQDKMLKEMLGLDFSELEADRATIYDGRTTMNRQLRDSEALYNAMPEHRGVPKEEISVADLAKQIATAQEHAHARRAAEAAVGRQQAEVERCSQEVGKLRAQLKAAEAKLFEEDEKYKAQLEAFAALAPNVDTSELQAKLDTAEATNAQVRANKDRAKAFEGLQSLEKKIAEASESITVIDEKKQAMLAAAEFPVPGLGFDEAGPTLNGVPLEQASQAEKVKLSCAIGLKMNPKLKILLIREGVFLDDESLVFLEELAEEHDAQVWIELVKTDDPAAVMIEDGAVREATAAE